MDHLRTALKLVQDGVSCLALADYPSERYEEFQAIADGLVEAQKLGLVYEVVVQRSRARKTYGHATQILIPGGLTPSGKRWLQDTEAHPIGLIRNLANRSVQQLPQKQPREIFQLRPTFMGVSIDLKALWRWIRKSKGGNA